MPRSYEARQGYRGEVIRKASAFAVATALVMACSSIMTAPAQAASQATATSVVLTAGEQLRIYRDGTLVSGDPATLKLTAHAEVVVWVGPATEHPDVPTQYAFGQGL